MMLLIDNYDSFTFNLYQLVAGLGADVRVVRNDAMSVAQIRELNPSHILLSPGPGYPKDAGVCEAAIAELSADFPMLGVCLGHQAICEVFGAKVEHARRLMHGKASTIIVDGDCPLFAGLPPTIQGARYHSLAARRETVPADLRVVATDPDGEVMAVAHVSRPLYGLQFHPESILTPDGPAIVASFLKTTGHRMALSC